MKFSYLLMLFAFLLGSCDFSQGVQRNYIISHIPDEEVETIPSHQEEHP